MIQLFKNQYALILGGSSGLGLATAKKLASHGMNLVLVHRNRRSELSNIEKEFAALRQKGVTVLSFNQDALKPENRVAILEELSRAGIKINVLIHSIAKGNLKSMTDSERRLQNADFQLTIEAMAISLYDWCDALRVNNLFTNPARIISFTSEGNQRAWSNYAAVSAAKTALEAITRNLALEYAPFGITANCIQAGVTETASFKMIPGSEQLAEHARQRNPFGRLTRPEDVANAVYLLCQAEAAWINGAILRVDGGEGIR